ncbi:MAG: N-acetylmuramoyl-L-alanine amidase [Bacteroidales bacterium]|nr:N-acetylmuramoyl-L-alanine amidase [Bacteroidales bacterium]
MTKICINGGHFVGVDPGAIGSRITEAELALDLMGRVAAYLEAAGCEVLTVHRSELEDICAASNEWGADLFVSIHCNAANRNARGTETFCYYGAGEGDALAHHIQSQIVTSLGTVDRGVKEAGFYVLRYTDCPAVLVETAFIDNTEDEMLLIDNTDEFARAIARGVTDYITREQ